MFLFTPTSHTYIGVFQWFFDIILEIVGHLRRKKDHKFEDHRARQNVRIIKKKNRNVNWLLINKICTIYVNILENVVTTLLSLLFWYLCLCSFCGVMLSR